MNRPWTMLVGICAFAILGCAAPSLHALAAPEPLIQDPGLVGEWISEGPAVTRVVLMPATGGKYTGVLSVQRHSELSTGLTLDVALTQIGADRHVDLSLAASERERLVARYGFLVLPVHQFMMIRRESDQLYVWTFSPDWIRGAGGEARFACDVLPIGGGEVAVITAHTDSIREFLLKHAHDDGALSPPMVFRRVVPGPTLPEDG